MNPVAAIASGERAEPFLAAVEERMIGTLSSLESQVREPATECIAAGGKRLRPLLAFAACPSDRPLSAHVVDGAAAVELVHTASMVHDDVLDDATRRRGHPTVEALHGTIPAVAVGDVLFSLAFALLTELPRSHAVPAVRRLAVAARSLAQGEVLQARQAYHPETSRDAYEARCAAKTGELFAAAMGIAARLSHAQDDAAVLERFASRVGVAFQIADDVLDCTGDPLLLGKEPGTDLRDGTVTLPLLLAARRDERVAVAIRLAADAQPDAAELALTLERVAASGAVAQSVERAHALVDAALRDLEALRGEFDLELLRGLARGAVERLS